MSPALARALQREGEETRSPDKEQAMPRAIEADVRKYLRYVDFPATRDDILRMAEKAGADEALREALKSLPLTDFETPDEVTAALGKTLH
jgi:hypothetical protein